jgi:hypothetical protein
MNRNGLVIVVLAASGLLAAPAFGQCCKGQASGESGVALGAVGEAAEKDAQARASVYPLTTCPVSGEKLGSMGEPVIKEYDLAEGGKREVRFCCASCVKDFEADQTAHWRKIDEEIVKQQLPYYPTDVCVVSDDKLGGEMGEPVNYVWRNRLVRLCCKGCVKDLNADPEKYLAKLDEAIVKQQREKYPLKTCMVSGQALGSMGEPTEIIAANRLVHFCCKDCEPKFKADPAKYLAQLEEAWKGASPPTKPADADTKSDHDHKSHDHGDHNHGDHDH